MNIVLLLERIRKSEEIDGKHFSEYVEEVKILKRSGKRQELENLLINIYKRKNRMFFRWV